MLACLAVLSVTTPSAAQSFSGVASGDAAEPALGHLGYQWLGGTLGVASGAALGLGTGLLLASLPRSTRLPAASAALGIGVGVIGIAVLAPLGIKVAGDRTGGRGRYWHTLAGCLLGAAVGLAPLTLVRSRTGWVVVTQLLLAAALDIGLGVFAYRLSAEGAGGEVAAEARAAVPPSDPADPGWTLRVAGRL